MVDGTPVVRKTASFGALPGRSVVVIPRISAATGGDPRMKQIGRLKLLATASLVAFGLGACGSSTQFTDIWKAPDISTIHGQKVLAVVITPNETMRRVGEEELVRNMPNVQAVASYTILDKDQVRDIEAAKAKVKDMGFDLAVTMRPVGTEEKTTYVPGSYVSAPYGAYYGSYWGYSAYAWPAVYEPGYMETTKYVHVETNIYSITDDKLLWSGRSNTADPGSAESLVRDTAQEAKAVLIQQGLISTKKK